MHHVQEDHVAAKRTASTGVDQPSEMERFVVPERTPVSEVVGECDQGANSFSLSPEFVMQPVSRTRNCIMRRAGRSCRGDRR